jgi:hydroxypyruvate isomerase
MKRREFLRTGVAALAGACCSDRLNAHLMNPAGRGRFRLKYAPHFGMFKHSAGENLTDQLKFAADQGFRAWQDNGLKARPVEVQEKIGRTLAALDMELGVFTASAASPAMHGKRQDDAACRQLLNDIRDSVEIAKRVHSKWIMIVPGGASDSRSTDWQSERGTELLKRCCDILEPHGMGLVLEPLSWSHPVPTVQTVDSPSYRILFDLCRWHSTAGGLVPSLDAAWPTIGYLHCADNPGRKEPGTGTIDYRTIFRQLAERGYTGIVGMEHGNSQPGAAGERAVIAAYAAAESA